MHNQFLSQFYLLKEKKKNTYIKAQETFHVSPRGNSCWLAHSCLEPQCWETPAPTSSHPYPSWPALTLTSLPRALGNQGFELESQTDLLGVLFICYFLVEKWDNFSEGYALICSLRISPTPRATVRIMCGRTQQAYGEGVLVLLRKQKLRIFTTHSSSLK